MALGWCVKLALERAKQILWLRKAGLVVEIEAACHEWGERYCDPNDVGVQGICEETSATHVKGKDTHCYS
jgi:hypothetical protein